jgi:hypothetical protein
MARRISSSETETAEGRIIEAMPPFQISNELLEKFKQVLGEDQSLSMHPKFIEALLKGNCKKNAELDSDRKSGIFNLKNENGFHPNTTVQNHHLQNSKTIHRDSVKLYDSGPHPNQKS